MKPILFIFLLSSFLVLFGCEEEDNSPKATVELMVWNATNTGASNPNAIASANATVTVFTTLENAQNNKSGYSGKTDANGKLSLSVPAQNVYYATAVNGNARNTKNTLVIVGIFKDLEQIRHAPAQTPAAQIGDLVFMDTNGDGAISAEDKFDFSIIGSNTATNTIKGDIYISE
jgi:hypothetical protein